MKKIIIYGVLAAVIFVGGMGVSNLRAGVKPLERVKAAHVPEGQVGLMRLVLEISDLNITPDQKVSIRGILKKHWVGAKPLFQKLNDSRIEVRDIIKQTPDDEERIRGAIYKRAELTADLAVLRGKVSTEVRNVLTAEQEQKIEAILGRVDRRLASMPDRVEGRLNQEE